MAVLLFFLQASVRGWRLWEMPGRKQREKLQLAKKTLEGFDTSGGW
jgi:hypothetical protein